jgi:hypothetical protein
VLEVGLLEKLQVEVLRPEVVEYILQRFEKQLIGAFDSMGGELERAGRRRLKLENEIRHLTQAIADGHYSPAIMADIAEREREIAEITNRLRESRPDGRQQLRGIRKFVTSRLADLRGILDSDVLAARTEIAKHIHSVTLQPEGRTYKATGTWDLLGNTRIVASGEREARMDDPTPRPKTAGKRNAPTGALVPKQEPLIFL